MRSVLIPYHFGTPRYISMILQCTQRTLTADGQRGSLRLLFPLVVSRTKSGIGSKKKGAPEWVHLVELRILKHYEKV